MLRVGIVGLPNVGKSSLFNALTAAGAPADNYPFCTVEPNVGTVAVPDRRVEIIHETTGSAEAHPTVIQFVDIAGLVEGASRGEGLGNQFLAQIREVDAIAHVLRCFEDPDVSHVMGSVDPLRDREVVEAELALADLETVERRREKVEKKARSGETEAREEMVVLDRVHGALSRGELPRTMTFSREERARLSELHLLSGKPVLYAANVGEGEAGEEDNPFLSRLRAVVEDEEGGRVVSISASLEAEMAALEPEERQAFLKDLGLEEAGLDRMIHAAYELMDLVTFFTTNETMTRAWTIRRGTRAPEAAGKIHSDFQRGFIRAETIHFDTFQEFETLKEAREQGAVRSEGKDYVVKDGDILLFRFNV